MGNGLVFLLRGRKLFGDSGSWEASAGGRQRHADGQPPAGAGQAAPRGLPFVVLHMPVCASHGSCVWSYEAIQKVTRFFIRFQNAHRDTEDHGPVPASALHAWTAEAFC